MFKTIVNLRSKCSPVTASIVIICAHNVEQIAVCNLASIALNRYVTADRKFDFKQLEYVTSVVVKNLNKIIDVNYYPVPEVKV